MRVEEDLQRQRRQDVEMMLSTKNGRRFLWRMLTHCGIYQDIHNDDARETERLLGRRSVGLWLMQVLGDIDQDKLFLMMKEAKEAQEYLDKLGALELDEVKKDKVQYDVNSFLS